MGPCLGNTSRARTHVRQHTLQRVTSEYPCCSTQWFRRKDSNLRKRNQKAVGRIGPSPHVANLRPIATNDDASIRAVPEASPTLERLLVGSALEFARWDVLDAFVLAVGDA